MEQYWREGLPPAVEGRLETTGETESKFIYVDEGDNKVSEKGCRYLAKAEWKQLQSIYMCNLFNI